jgi:hypothetical protein
MYLLAHSLHTLITSTSRWRNWNRLYGCSVPPYSPCYGRHARTHTDTQTHANRHRGNTTRHRTNASLPTAGQEPQPEPPLCWDRCCRGNRRETPSWRCGRDTYAAALRLGSARFGTARLVALISSRAVTSDRSATTSSGEPRLPTPRE